MSSLEGARAKASQGDDQALEALRIREERIRDMELKKGRFQELLAVLESLELKLKEGRERLSSKQKVDDNTMGEIMKKESRAWGKAVEKEGEKVLELCVHDVMKQEELLLEGGDTLRLLTSVFIQSLDGPELMEIRQNVVEKKAWYRGIKSPKGELDGLIVLQRAGDEKMLKVVMPVEMKRNLDEVGTDCLKFALLLDICREASSAGRSDLIRFSHGRQSGTISSSNGYALDFSTNLPPAMPDMAVYLTKRGGNALRAASKLILEQISLFGGPEEVTCSRIRRFYGPNFVSEGNDDAGTIERAEEEREKVIDEMHQVFVSVGMIGLQRRMNGLKQTLTDEVTTEEGVEEDDIQKTEAQVELKNVFLLSPSSPSQQREAVEGEDMSYKPEL